jgi:predicted dienelactone hydrolase
MKYAAGPRQFVERTRQLGLVVDHLTRGWDQAPAVDGGRIGLFGYSAGAATAVIAAGGRPDFGRFFSHCNANPEAYDCRFVREMMKRGGSGGLPAQSPAGPPPVHGQAAPPPQPDGPADPRIKAVVLAAPALGYLFEGGGAGRVRASTQIWAAERDETAPRQWNAEALRREIKAAEYREVAGAGHGAFIAPCDAALAQRSPGVCKDPGGFDRAAFHREFNREVTAFFRRTLKGR